MKPPRLHPNVLQQPFQKSELSPRVVITFQVMAVSRVSPGNPDPVRSTTQRRQNELGAHPG
jgi:hypothetical protein